MWVKMYDESLSLELMESPAHDERTLVASFNVASLADIPTKEMKVIIDNKKYEVIWIDVTYGCLVPDMLHALGVTIDLIKS